MNTLENLTKSNVLNPNIGNGIGIALAEEKHEHEEVYDTWGGDIGRAALGGAITGLASGIGIKGGEFLGKLAGNAFSDLVSSSLSKSMTQVLTASVNASVNTATMSTMNTVGTAMSNTTIYGGNFKDVLSAGRDSLRDKDNLKSIAVSTLGAGITTGLSKYIDGKFNNVISKGTMQGASFKDQMYSALLENGLSNSVNVALESSISGDSFKESLKRQGLNMLSGTIETLGSKYIGNNYHNNEFSDNKVINKTTQLTLHAGLGAITSKISGGDYLNGVVSGVVGEVVGELVFNKLNENSANKSGVFTVDQFNQNKETATNIAGLFSGLSSIIVSSSQGKDIDDISTNAYVGQRIGQNAAKYNSTNVAPVLDDKGNVVKDKYRVISADKDGDRSIYNMASGGEKIGESYSDTEFLNPTCESGNCTIHLDVKLDFEGIANGADKLGGFLNLALESKTGGAYDIKNSLIDLGYTNSKMDGIVDYKTGIVMNGDTAGNYLYGVNTGTLGIGTYKKTQNIADIYHNYSNNTNSGEPQNVKNIIYNGYNSAIPNQNKGLNLIDLRIRTNNNNLENVRKNIK